MKSTRLLTLTLFAASSLLAADTASTNQFNDAIAKLKSAASYSWTVTFDIPNMPFTPEPLKGKTQKDGIAFVTQPWNETTMEAAFNGSKTAIKLDDKWQLPNEGDERAVFVAGILTRAGTPADEAEDLRKKAKELTAGEGGLFSADYTEAGAKELLTFGPRRANSPPPPKDAKGSVKFWFKDGALTKYQSYLRGKVTFGPDGEEQDFQITRTVEVQEVGTAKVEVPAEVKKLLETKESKP